MTPQEVIDGLEKVKAWDPREFIVAVCDEATFYLKRYEDSIRAIADSAAPLALSDEQRQAAPTLEQGTVDESAASEDPLAAPQKKGRK